MIRISYDMWLVCIIYKEWHICTDELSSVLFFMPKITIFKGGDTND